MTEKRDHRTDEYLSATESTRLTQAMEQYLAELENGLRPDREQFLSRYPEIAEELDAGLEGIDFIHCVAPQLKEQESSQTKAPCRPLATVGDYRIVRELGRGGMGVVYEAVQLSLGRAVALKVLPFAAMLDDRQLKRFQNEARAMALLDHPHIVSVHGFGVDRGVYFYAMRLIDGHSLDHVLQDLRKRAKLNKSRQRRTEQAGSEQGATDSLDESKWRSGESARSTDAYVTEATTDHVTRRDTIAAISTQLSGNSNESNRTTEFYRSVARIGMQAAEALEHAHESGVLHRDIKPGNLLIDARGGLWVSDFGLAQVKTDLRLTRCGDVVGTLRYMSPEQLLGKNTQIEPRSDIYSLGATLYELVTLQPLFDARDRQQLIKQISLDEPLSPRQIDARIPLALSTIIHKCVQQEPGDRFSSAQELADDLKRFLRDQRILTQPPTISEKAARWLRHHRSLAWTFAIVMADMRLAFDIYSNLSNSSDLDQIQQILSRYEFATTQDVPRNPEDARNFAWYYLKNLIGANPRQTLAGHEGAVYHVAFSPDGKAVATVSQDHTARLWDLATGQLKFTLEGHADEVNCLVFSPDGKILLTSSDDRTVKFWDTSHGTERSDIEIPRFDLPVSHIVFSPDGNLVVLGELLLKGNVATTTVWDLATRQKKYSLSAEDLLTVSPDGATLATTSTNGSIKLWNLSDGQVYAVLPNELTPLTAMFSADSQELVVGGHSNLLETWDIASTKLLRRFSLFEPCTVEGVAYSPDGKWIAAAEASGSVSLWEAKTGLRRHMLRGNGNRVWGVAFSPDGKTLAGAADNRTARLWDISSRDLPDSLPKQPEPISSISFSADSQILSTTTGSSPIRLWNINSGDSKPEQFQSQEFGQVYCSAFAPSDRLLALATFDGNIHLIDQLDSKKLSVIAGPKMSIGSLAFSKDGSILAGDCDDRMIIWDTQSSKTLYDVQIEGHNPGPQRFVFSPDGKTMAISSRVNVEQLELSTGRVTELRTGHRNNLNCVSYSPDGQMLATGSDDRSIKLWDTRLQQEIATLRGHTNDVKCLAFSPDGRTLASGGQDRVIRLWDVATRQELFSLAGHTGIVRHAAFAPDGSTLVTVADTADGKRAEIRFWRAVSAIQARSASE